MIQVPKQYPDSSRSANASGWFINPFDSSGKAIGLALPLTAYGFEGNF